MKNYIISALIILLISMGIMMFLTLPEYSKFVDSSQRLQLDKTELSERKQYLSETVSILQGLRQHQSSLDKISSALPSYPDLPSLMIFLYEKASESGLIATNPRDVSTVYLVNLDATDNKQEIKPIIFSLALTGNYLSLKNFIQTVEASSRLIRISDISTQEDENILNGHMHSITFEAFFYQN